jgi:hypothetical protein
MMIMMLNKSLLKKGMFLMLLGLVTGLLGCTYYIGEMENYVPEPPQPAPQPPEIFNPTISPTQVPAGSSTPITITFQYKDWNGDVGPASADVELRLDKISGNFNITQPVHRLSSTIHQKSGTYGREGTVTMTKNMSASAGAQGVVSITVALFDQAGHKSQLLPVGQITIGGSPQPVGNCQFVDGNGNPRSSFRIGQQVFFRVVDPDENISSDTQDQINNPGYPFGIYINSQGRLDVEVIPVLTETGINTGTFIGPPGGFLLVQPIPGGSFWGDGQLEAFDGDTLMAQYVDPNNPGDVCIAVAKIQ